MTDNKSVSTSNYNKKSTGCKTPPNPNDSTMTPASMQPHGSDLKAPPEIRRKLLKQPFAAGIPSTPPNIESAKITRNRRKILGRGILSNKSLFLRDEVQDKIVIGDDGLMEGVVLSVLNKNCNFWNICWYNDLFSVKIRREHLHTQVPKENATLKQKLFQGRDEYDKLYPCTNKTINHTKNIGQVDHPNAEKKTKPKQDIKFPHDSAQRAFADLQMSPHPMDRTQLDAATFHCGDKQSENNTNSESLDNSDSIADDGSVSNDEMLEQGAIFIQSNVMDEYVPDENYHPEWMEMDGNYKTSINTELKWTYSNEPSCKEGMHSSNGPGPCLKNFTTNRFNDPLEACAVAGGLDRDLLLHVTFNSNRYARGKGSQSGIFAVCYGRIYR